MKLLTKVLERTMPPLGAQDGKGDEAIAYVKFFDPQGSWTWYGTEYDPVNREFFGLVDGHERELGYFSLDELATFRGRFGLGIERDVWFKPTTLAVIRENRP